MRIVVDRLPDCPRDCLFSTSMLCKGGRYYICSLHPYIEEADINDDGYKPDCVCRDTSKCKHLTLEVL